MANAISPPNLYDKVALKYSIHRAFDVTIFVLLISLLFYRLLNLSNHGFAWLLALLCESCFTFIWVLTLSTKWNPVEYKTYPERLSQKAQELPPVDIFVTTTDPVLEPPILTVNTVISLLAVDYPVDKLACYVSDDGCSSITYYSLVEASKFAKLWVPFCKKYNIQSRAPFRYFSSELSLTSNCNSLEFQQEYNMMKDEYEELASKIESVVEISTEWDLSSDFATFSNIEIKNHRAIIKVIWENKAGLSDVLPHLVYISREKRPNHPHHCKAGAMNVLTRVSGLISNAPFMLNVDCDMFVNNPQTVRHAMCLLLDSKNERESGFVQFPQYFYDELKDDPFGNQFVTLYKVSASKILSIIEVYIVSGVAGIQGPLYEGTGCFHRRNVIYGSCPDDIGNQAKGLSPLYGDLADKEQLKILGNSKEFIRSATYALQGKASVSPKDLSNLIEAAHQVAGCGYEHGTSWGTEVGWQYGSATEDILTGLMIHARGWSSVLCTPDPHAFLGCAPSGGPISMTQQKRWATGISETVFEVTQKDQSSNDGGDEGRFTFDASPIFVPGTTVLLLQLTALVMGFRDMPPSVNNGSGLGEILCSILVVTCLWPFMKGLLAKGKYGIPLSTICKSALLALSFVHLVRRTSKGQN
ncbi:unnamed protein product [Dovyalis caffra]|uniref:Cellulose synthase-like protein H1 n=1 Tax=Dovyalis caffra TaxID=77055 RepID=A0AAV1SFF2_9ROSI|nr:unnamed protein product [Dovyalis caffra]